MKLLLLIALLVSPLINAKCVEVSDHAFGDGSIETNYLQAAITLAGENGCLNFNRNIRYDGTLTVPPSQTWTGTNDTIATQNTTSLNYAKLIYSGNAHSSIDASDLFLDKMYIQGNDGISSPLPPTIGLNIVDGNIRTRNSTIRGFSTLIKVRGSYYNLIEASNLMHANVIYDGGDVNNLNFTNTKLSRFDIGVKYWGGFGGINFRGGSIEKWTTAITMPTSGAKVSINVNQVYIENYPTDSTSMGLVKTTYHSVFGFISSSSISITQSPISTKGIERLIYDYGNGTVQLSGNRIVISADVERQTKFIVYSIGVIPLLIQKDTIEFMRNGAFVPYNQSDFSVKQIAGGKLNYEYIGFDKKMHSSGAIP